ncbi:MAG: ATP synthase F0 subunit B [Acidobacteriota bacterium]|nr:ATP synthase F0 subunit B [Blastocatellia bacterium]MDW8412725.1 ATP synthase F0 subunit B [Acidobacteriota bacterium]
MFCLAFADSSLLAPDLSILFTVAIFIALVFVLDRIILTPVGQVLDEREKRTSGTIADAKKVLQDYEQRLADYQRRIREAKAENYKMLEERRTVALAERAKKLEAAREEAAREIEAGRKEIEAAVRQARESLEDDAAAMAKSIAASVLRRPLGG